MRRSVDAKEEVFVMATPVGKLAVYNDGQSLTRVEYSSKLQIKNRKLSSIGLKIKKQIERYFRTPDKKFDLCVCLQGTAFQNKVWRALQRIPAGRTMTYGELANKLNSSPRAVGNACRNNPVSLVVPCHRVVARTGLGGFGGKLAGANISRKRWLLNHEGVSNL